MREPKATEVGQETIKRLTLILFLHRYTGTRSDVDVGGRRGGNESRNDDSLPTPTEYRAEAEPAAWGANCSQQRGFMQACSPAAATATACRTPAAVEGAQFSGTAAQVFRASPAAP